MCEEEQERKTTEAYEKLLKNMPSIGFINRKKRIKAYIQLAEIADYMIESNEINEDQALFIFSLLMRKCSNFQKAAMMTALTLNSIGKGVISPIGVKFSLDVRKNLSLPSTHHSDEITNSDEKDA
ncbi:MAG: hypothetical protein IBX55_21065 [Methyloprofundus sp.]|nr:hypothetical protein [Methyloprofundus sp.]MBW6454235.1 hypothetical protein [Methyloprofundus sp.]